MRRCCGRFWRKCKPIRFAVSENQPFERRPVGSSQDELCSGVGSWGRNGAHACWWDVKCPWTSPDFGFRHRIPDYSWNMLIRASNPAFSCGRSPVSLEPLSIRLNRLENRTIEPVINRLTAKGAVTRRQVDFPVRNPHRFGPFHGPDASSVHYPGAQDTRASLCHNRFQSVAP